MKTSFNHDSIDFFPSLSPPKKINYNNIFPPPKKNQIIIISKRIPNIQIKRTPNVSQTYNSNKSETYAKRISNAFERNKLFFFNQVLNGRSELIFGDRKAFQTLKKERFKQFSNNIGKYLGFVWNGLSKRLPNEVLACAFGYLKLQVLRLEKKSSRSTIVQGSLA